jgi:hypothetical protein
MRAMVLMKQARSIVYQG